jgi:UPF0271 protein
MLYFILRDKPELLRIFLQAQISLFGQSMPFFGLSGTSHETICKELGVPFVPEVFVDIDYDPSTPEGISRKVTRMFENAESRSYTRFCFLTTSS